MLFVAVLVLLLAFRPTGFDNVALKELFLGTRRITKNRPSGARNTSSHTIGQLINKPTR